MFSEPILEFFGLIKGKQLLLSNVVTKNAVKTNIDIKIEIICFYTFLRIGEASPVSVIPHPMAVASCTQCNRTFLSSTLLKKLDCFYDNFSCKVQSLNIRRMSL